MPLGAIAGDIAGSAYEHHNEKTTSFDIFPAGARFTDDSVLTVAVADAILSSRSSPDYHAAILGYARAWPGRGYGGNFRKWIASADPQPYNSFGNGSAMRVSPVGWAFDDEATVLEQARLSAMPTHDHPNGIKGAQAVALAVFLARKGSSKDEIRERMQSSFGYDMERTVEEIRPDYSSDVTCQGSVPEAIIAFLDSNDFEGAIRNAISLGGDADTQACIAGSIAEAFYGGVPEAITRKVEHRLDPVLLGTVRAFREACGMERVRTGFSLESLVEGVTPANRHPEQLVDASRGREVP